MVIYFTATGCIPLGGLADPMSFDLTPLGKMNKVDVRLATGFGSGAVKGRFSQVKGVINFSVKQPSTTSGQFKMDSRTLRFGYGKINGDAQNSEWLDSSQFPQISFTLERLSNPSWYGDYMKADASGRLRIKKNAVPISVPVFVKYLRAERRAYDGKSGDVLLVQGEFPLSRGQFGINSGSALDSIFDAVTVRIQLMAGSDKVRPFLPCRVFGGHP